jgi:EAL domain-containing protein (putative c-di-GMP-specific phosphodiesterase class I)
MDRYIHEHDRLERDLRAALAAGQVDAVFEPSIDLASGHVVGFEAMPRWVPPDRGEVLPERFIPIAEHTGLIHDLARHLLGQACAAARRWPPEVRLAIDLFPSLLSDRELPAWILDTLAEHSIATSRLELEITESLLVRDAVAAEAILGTLHAAGVRITLDHFGTGYSSLYHLRKCKLDKVKIDSIFIRDMDTQREKARLVSGLVGLGQGLGLEVAGCGVGNVHEGASLRQSGCREGQGGWVGAPLSVEGTLKFFAERVRPAAPRS